MLHKSGHGHKLVRGKEVKEDHRENIPLHKVDSSYSLVMPVLESNHSPDIWYRN